MILILSNFKNYESFTSTYETFIRHIIERHINDFLKTKCCFKLLNIFLNVDTSKDLQKVIIDFKRTKMIKKLSISRMLIIMKICVKFSL